MISLHAPCSSTGGWQTGLWWVTGCLCCSFLLTLCPWLSMQSFPQETILHNPLHGLLYGLQFFRNCYSISPFHGVQSIRNRLFQHGIPTSSSPGTCYSPDSSLHRCTDPPGACSSMGSPQGHNFLQAHSPVLPWGTAQAADGSLSIMDLHVLQEHSFLTIGGTTGCREISAPPPGAPPPSSSLICRFAELFLSHILSPVSWLMLHSSFFPPFLDALPQRHYCHHWWAQPWLATGPARIWLAMALSDMGEACGSFSQKPSL